MGLTIEIQAIFELFFRQFLDVGKRKGNAPAIVKFSTELAQKLDLDKSGREQLISEVQKIIEKHDIILTEKFTQVISFLHSKGIAFDKKIPVGIMKGLLIQRSAGFVSGEEFDKSIERHITEVLKSKLPVTMLDDLKLKSSNTSSKTPPSAAPDPVTDTKISKSVVKDQALGKVANNYVKNYGTFLAAQGVKDLFFLVRGEKSLNEFSGSLKSMLCPESIAGYNAFAVTSAAINTGGQIKTNKITGRLHNGGVYALGMTAGMEVDQLTRLIVANLGKGMNFKDAINKATNNYFEQFDPERVGMTTLSFIGAKQAVNTGKSSILKIYKLIQSARKVENAASIFATAGGGGTLGKIMEEAVTFIIVDEILKHYLERTTQKHLRTLEHDIAKLVNNVDDNNIKESFETIALEFAELREIRKAWVHENDKNVKKSYGEFEKALTEVTNAKQNLIWAGKTPLTDLNDLKKCYRSVSKVSLAQTDECLSAIPVCQYLHDLKRLAKGLEDLEHKKVIYQKTYQSLEKTQLRPSDDNQFSDIGNITSTDLNRIEQKTYEKILSRLGITIERDNNTPKIEGDSSNKLQELALDEYATQTQRMALSETISSVCSPVDRLHNIQKLSEADNAINPCINTCQEGKPLEKDLNEIENIANKMSSGFPNQNGILAILAEDELWNKLDETKGACKVVTIKGQCHHQDLRRCSAEKINSMLKNNFQINIQKDESNIPEKSSGNLNPIIEYLFD